MVRFTKYSGAGNDFVVTVPGEEVHRKGAETARLLCSRRRGVGVDGLILVYPTEDPGRLDIRFFNPDGSEFSTCGNGTRCAARFAVDKGLVGGGPFTLVTSAGPIIAEVAEDVVTVEYRMPASRRGPIAVRGPDGPADGWLMDFGVPHFVLPLECLPDGDIDAVCSTIRNDPQLGPEGANVNLIAMRSDEAAAVRTFERGVEGETLACGSGSMASVIAMWADNRGARSVSVDVQGGATLRVELVDEPVFDGTPIRVRLSGPVVRLFEGEFGDLRLAE